jgi:hypothetical protein
VKSKQLTKIGESSRRGIRKKRRKRRQLNQILELNLSQMMKAHKHCFVIGKSGVGLIDFTKTGAIGKLKKQLKAHNKSLPLLI